MLRLPSPSLAISITALVISLGGAGYTATGGNFILGATNSANAVTRLVGAIPNSALRVENPTNAAGATGINITTNASRPPLVVSSDAKVQRLNADLLDGVDSSDFGRLFAFDTFGASKDLVSGNNYVFTLPFTPDLKGRCLVTVSAQIRGNLTSDVGPFLRAAIRVGDSAPKNDNDSGHYFLHFSDLDYAPDMTRSATFLVSAGQSVKFGAFFGEVPPDWAGTTADVHVTILCTTVGQLSTPVSAEAKANDKQG
jgi:hypothetical protein